MQENDVPLYIKKYDIRYKDVNDRQEATPVAIMNFVEETAADHCAHIGKNVYDLQKEGRGWVLYAGCFHMDQYPHYRENIKIVTWISKKIVSPTELIHSVIEKEHGTLLATASTTWIWE